MNPARPAPRRTHSNLRRSGWLLAVPVLVSLACTAALGGPPKPTAVPGAPTAAVATLAAATAAPGQPTLAATQAPKGTKAAQPTAAGTAVPLVFGAGAFNLPDATAHLGDLSGYQASLTLSFEGTSVGQGQKWSKTYRLLSTQDPAARQLTLDRSGDLPELSPIYLAEVAGVAYQVLGEKSCTAAGFKPESAPTLAWEPAGLLTGVIGADEAGAETVNDVPSNHYTFTEGALGLAGLAKAQGELWVAADGGFLVKYVLATTGAADYFGADTTGVLTWDYELTQPNQPAAFSLPADCPAGLVSAPRLPDAANVQDLPGLLAYDTAASLADAVTFYQDQLPPLGWALTGDPVDVAALPADQTTVILDFTQADQTLSVILTHTDAGTQVRLAQAGAQK